MAMLALSAALIRRLLPQLSEDIPRAEGLRTWIGTGSFYVASGTVPDEFLLQNVALTELVPFVSFDYERFALSSFESLLYCSVEATTPKALGWPIARLYYSAFFGAHAIMRATGHAVLRLEGPQAARLSEIGSFYVPNLKVGSGTYHSLLIQNSQLSIDKRLRKLPDVGGAHDQFWRSFYAFLGGIGEEVSASNELEATDVVGQTSEIRDILGANGFNGGTWLSAMRNQLTYQHKYGVWFPFQSSSADVVEYIRRLDMRDSSSVRRDYDPAKYPMLAFCACCHLLATVSSDLANGLCQRGRNNRFKHLWTRLAKTADTA